MKFKVKFSESNQNFKTEFGDVQSIHGKDGEPGKDGISATHSWNGTVLTMTSASGTSSADLKGDEGAPGKDGKDGQDYVLTADDRNEIAGIVETNITPTLIEIRETAEQAETIARGRATGYVFDTLADLETALTDEGFVASLVLGDNLYIRATDVPDYWWDGTTKQQLEAEKPDLTGFVKEADVQNMIDASLAAIGVAEEGSY